MSVKGYSAYKNTGVDWLKQIPSHWTITRLGFECETLVPMRDKPQDLGGSIPWIRIEDFSGKYISESKSEQGVSTETVESMNLKVFPVGTVLCSCSCSMGATAIVTTPLVTNQTFIGIFPGQNYRSEFLYYLFIAAAEYLNSIGTGAIQTYLSRDDFRQLRMPCPDLREQTAIAAFLDSEAAKIDALIAEQERLLVLLAEKRQATISHAVTRGLNSEAPMKSSGIAWIGDIPAHWEIHATKRIFALITDAAPDDNGEELLSLYTDIGVRPRKSLEERGNRATTTDGYWVVRKGDIVVNKLLAWMGAIGISEYDGVTSPAYDILRPKKPINPKYYDYLFRCGIMFTEFRRWSRGIMDMRLRLYFEDFGQIHIPCPPEQEQNKIVEVLGRELAKIDALKEVAERAINLLKERRMALITAAVTGEIDVRNVVPDALAA